MAAHNRLDNSASATPKVRKREKLDLQVRQTAKRRQVKNGLCKRGKYWWVCVKRGGKKIERSTRCTDRSDAVIVRDALLRQLGLGERGIEVKGPFDTPSLLSAAKDWAKAHEGVVADRYREQMIEAIDTHFSKWNHLPLDEITTAVCEEARRCYLATMGRKTLKGITFEVPHTIGGANRLIRLISALYGWALKRKLISQRPWHLGERKVQQVPRVVLWPEQVRPFFESVKSHTRSRAITLAIQLQIGLGLRETESATARWEWVSWRTQSFNPGATKNRKTRQIPIPPWLLHTLGVEWDRQGKPTTGLILEEASNRGFTKNAVRAAGVDLGIEGLHPHRLRATFATAHFESGTPLAQIMLMLGHEKPPTTMRYIETRPKGAAEAQAKVAEALGLGSPLGSPMKEIGV